MVGIISYNNNSGLGQMARALRGQKIVNSQMIIRHPIKDPKNILDIDIPHTYADLEPTKEQLYEYLNICNPDVVVIIETPFNFEFFQELHSLGKKVVLIPMIDSIGMEKFIPYQKYIDLVIHPTAIGYGFYQQKGWKGNFVYLPWPTDTAYFNPKHLDKPVIFLHNEGFGGAGFRKGTDKVLTAFKQLWCMYPSIDMHIRGQRAEFEHSQIQRHLQNVSIANMDFDNNIDIYKGGKIYIAPSRREGLGLPIPEAMACGLPVITTDAPPMNERFSKDYPLLVKVYHQSMLPYGDIPLYDCSVLDLMNKMKFAAENLDLMEEIGKQNCRIIEESFSWHVLKDKWSNALNDH